MTQVNRERVRRRYEARCHISGGVLKLPTTPAQSLGLYLRMRRLKVDFLRRAQQREESARDS